MELLKKYFSLSQQQIEQFKKAEDLYKEWNGKINVISRKDMDNFVLHHLLHSLSIAKIQPFNEGAQVLDIGTGGGFPGVPLAILFPHVHFVLVDSIGKKIKVVEEISRALELKNVTAKNMRAEQLNEKFDFIVSRAVTQMNTFVTWTCGKFKEESSHELKNGILYLKGGDLSEELLTFSDAKVYNLSGYFAENFFETKKVVYLSQ